MGTPLEKITNEELKAIEHHILDCCDTELCGEPLAATVPYLLREWNTQKRYLFDNVFDGKLILSRHAVFTKDANQIQSELNNAWDRTLSTGGKRFWRDFSDFCRKKRQEVYGGSLWFDLTPEKELKENQWYRCESLLSDEVLAKNEVLEEFVIDLPKPDGSFRPYKVQKGSRPMRVLNRLNKAFNFGNDEDLKELAVWQSRYLNDKRLEGEVCLSIHPLDYMTMSQNNCDWTSCMNWPEGGCYRGGTIEMMNSPMVIVAYLKSKKDPLMMYTGWDPETKESQYMEWNSKKWRILICVNEYGIFSVKGYPYQHKEMTQFIMEWIASLFKDRTFHESKKFRPYRGQKLDNEGTTIDISPRTNRMYNDFGTCDHYMMLDTNFMSTLIKEENNFCDFTYSGASECMHCGALDRDNEYFKDESMLACTACTGDSEEDLSYCDLCGAGYSEDEMIWVEDTLVCPECFESECFEDAWTFEYGFNDNSSELFIKLTNEEEPLEIGRCIDRNISRWIKEDILSKYKDQTSTGSVTIKQEDLNFLGRHLLERTLAEREKGKNWVF